MIAKPSYKITPDILFLVGRIGEAIGRAEEAGVLRDVRLRRTNRIRAIRSSLAIEGYTLNEEEISAIRDGKPVAAPTRDIQEVRGAIKAYDQYRQWNPASEFDLLRAHQVLMAGVPDTPGQYRRTSVGIMDGGENHHISPPAESVPRHMANLLAWLGDTDEHPLIASAVFHYEFEFIHPFQDGNGRMGRLWQTLILTRWKSLFASIPIESLVHANQEDYYRAIRQRSAEGARTSFIVFMLGIILEALEVFGASDQADDQVSDQVSDQHFDQVSDQVKQLIAALGTGPRSAAELMGTMGLLHRPTFRKNYLHPAISAGLMEMTRPESPTAKNQKYRLAAKGREVLEGLGVGQ